MSERSTADIAPLLERVTDRIAVDGHDGRSGAHLERGVLDGRRVIVKTVEPDSDLSLILGGDRAGVNGDCGPTACSTGFPRVPITR